MKATGIVRRIDDLGRVVIPKEIRRTMRIREGDPSLTILEPWERFCGGMMGLERRMGREHGLNGPLGGGAGGHDLLHLRRRGAVQAQHPPEGMVGLERRMGRGT